MKRPKSFTSKPVDIVDFALRNDSITSGWNEGPSAINSTMKNTEYHPVKKNCTGACSDPTIQNHNFKNVKMGGVGPSDWTFINRQRTGKANPVNLTDYVFDSDRLWRSLKLGIGKGRSVQKLDTVNDESEDNISNNSSNGQESEESDYYESGYEDEDEYYYEESSASRVIW